MGLGLGMRVLVPVGAVAGAEAGAALGSGVALGLQLLLRSRSFFVEAANGNDGSEVVPNNGYLVLKELCKLWKGIV